MQKVFYIVLQPTRFFLFCHCNLVGLCLALCSSVACFCSVVAAAAAAVDGGVVAGDGLETGGWMVVRVVMAVCSVASGALAVVVVVAFLLTFYISISRFLFFPYLYVCVCVCVFV